MKPICPARPQLQRLLAEQLDASDDAALTRHVEACLNCQALLVELSDSSEEMACSGVKATDAAEEIIERLKGRLPETIPDSRSPNGDVGASSPPAERRSLPQVPGYEVLEEIGRGGMGVIYRARQLGLNRIVALKMLRSDIHRGERTVSRLRAEAEAVARLHHPNIVQIYEVGERAEQPYLSLEYVAGGSLRQWLDGKPRPPHAAAELIETVARAMDAAHGHGLVHRDLKPANILLAPVQEGGVAFAMELGERCVPKIADFGLVKWLDGDAPLDGALTQTGEVMGTPNYMAPEQARAEAGKIGPATDVYALGAVLYELLTGRPPFVAVTAVDTLLRVVHDDPVSATRLSPALPIDLATVAMKCLEKDPNRRYATAGALADELERFRQGRPVQARPLGFLGRTGRWGRRNPLLATLWMALAFVFLLGFAVSLWQMSEAQSSAVAESAARRDAETQKNAAVQRAEEAEQQRRRAERAAALARLEQGLAWCRQGDVKLGLSLMADSLIQAEHAQADDLPFVIRSNLAAWSRHVPERTHSPPHGSSVLSVAVAPDGGTTASGPIGNAWGKLGPAEVHLWDTATWKPRGPKLTHAHSVFALAFSADGRFLACASGHRCDAGVPGEVKVWNVAEAKLAYVLPHPASVYAVAFSPDGKTLLSGCRDGTARLWPAREGQRPIQEFSHTAAIFTVAFSPDGRTLLSAGKDGCVRLWETATGNLRHVLTHTAAVRAAAFAPDGRRVLTGCTDHTARLWDVATGKPLVVPMMNGHPVCAVAFHPTKSLLATGGGSFGSRQFGRGEIRLWDAATATPVGPALSGEGGVLGLAFTPDGRYLIAAKTDGAAHAIDVSAWHPLALTVRHAPGVRWTRFSPDGRALLTIAHTKQPARHWGEMRVWDAISGAPLGPPIPARTVDDNGIGFLVHFSGDGKTLLNHLPDRSVLLRDARTGRRLGPPAEGGHHLVFRSDGKQFCILRGQDVLLWDAVSDKQIGPPLSLPESATAAAFHPDGQRLLTACGAGVTSLWDLATRRRIGEPIRHDSAIKALAFAPNGETFLTVDGDNTIRRWQTRDGRQVGPPLPDDDKNPREHFRSLRFTRDGQQIVSELWQSLYLWDSTTGHRLARFPNTAVAWEAEDTLLGYLYGDSGKGVEGSVHLWDVRQRQIRAVPLPREARCLDIQPGGRLLATGDDERVQLWDTVTGLPVGPPFEHPAPLITLSFSADGRRLLTCCGDEMARLWNVPLPLPGDGAGLKLWVETLTVKSAD